MLDTMKNALHIFLSAVLVIQLSGCGTILYPERRGQKAGHIDVGVALLDGIGLLFFLIPGIIAFAVDFSNGTIYLPATGRLSANTEMKQIKFDPNNRSLSNLERIIKEETGHEVKLDQDNLKIVKLESTDELKGYFAKAAEVQNNRLALLK